MDCRDATELLAGHALGDLAPADRDDLEAHLAACDACHQIAEESAAALGRLRRFAEDEARAAVPPADVDHAVRVGRALLARDAPTPTAPAAPLSPPSLPLGRRVLRAAVVLLAVVGAAALLDARIAVGDGALEVSLALPGTRARRTSDGTAAAPRSGERAVAPLTSPSGFPPYASLDAPRMEHAVHRVVQDAVQDAVRPMLTDVAGWLLASEDRRAELTAYLDERRRQDAETVAELLALTRRDIEDTRDSQEALWSVVRGIPATRTPR